MKNFEKVVVIVCIVSAIVISFAALFMPPQGIIDSSVLFLIAEFLLFCGSVMGIRMKSLDALADMVKKKLDDNKGGK